MVSRSVPYMKTTVMQCDGPRCSNRVIITGGDKIAAKNWRSIRRLDDASRNWENDVHFCNFVCMRNYIESKDVTGQ